MDGRPRLTGPIAYTDRRSARGMPSVGLRPRLRTIVGRRQLAAHDVHAKAAHANAAHAATGCPLTEDRVALTQRIKEANDIVDVVGSYISLRPAGPTFKGLCPFHDDNRPSFDVDPRRQRYKCWSCGKSGDVFTFIMEMDKVSFPEAQELLARRAGIPLEKLKSSPQNPTRARMLDVMRWAAAQFQHCLLEDFESTGAAAARAYLGERKLTGETVRKFGL